MQLADLPPENANRRIVTLSPEEALTASSGDDQAVNEAKQFASGLSADELAEQANALEHTRTQRFKNNFEWIAIGAMWAFALTLLAIAGTWLWHLLTPPSLHWLTPEGLAHVQNIFTGGILAGVVADHFKKRLG